jgi:BirA family transcriptional regulator, biotin operon repressor / biotin---[acetyl-CoA-carboxylase] ligase
MIGEELIWLKKTDSTNQYLQDMLKKTKIPEGTMVIAEEQTLGRGQRGNHWESSTGENLTFSFVIYPDFLELKNQFMLSKIIALALFDLLKRYTGDVKIKWPNDIYIGKKKVAGILLENVIKGTKLSNTIVGIGLNINQKIFSEALPFASSLSLETGNDYKLPTILNELISNLNSRYNELKKAKYEKLNQQYLNALYQFMQFHDYSANNEVFNAKIVGIEDDGRLCLSTSNNELLKFAFKEVAFL